MQPVSHHARRRAGRPFLALIASIILAGLTATPHAAAQDSFRVGIVDLQAIFQQSAYGKRKRAEFEEHEAARKKVLGSDEEEVMKLQEKFLASRESGGTDLASVEEQLQRKFRKYQQREQTFRQEMSQKRSDMMTEYVEQLQVAAKTIAERENLALIVDLNVALYVAEKLNVTEDVLKEFETLHP